MKLKELDISEFVPLTELFMEEVKPHDDTMYVWEHDGKTYIVAYFESCIYDLMEVDNPSDAALTDIGVYADNINHVVDFLKGKCQR